MKRSKVVSTRRGATKVVVRYCGYTLKLKSPPTELSVFQRFRRRIRAVLRAIRHG